MILPEKKERENRFKLALRMSLPIFLLGLLPFFTLINRTENGISLSYYISGTFILAVMVYFFLYMIYRGFDERITDPITHTFTREYLYKLLKKEIQKKTYTIVLLSIENLHSINEMYGIKNGDNVLHKVVHEITEYFSQKSINDFPLGHIKGGDFIIGLEGDKEQYLATMDLLCLKFSNFKIDDIEISLVGAMTDSNFSKNLDFLIDHLFEEQMLNKNTKELLIDENSIDQSSLEISIIGAVKNKDFKFFTQKVYASEVVFEDLSIKLQVGDNLIHHNKFMPLLNRMGLRKEYELMLIEAVANKIVKYENIYAFTITPATIRDPHFLSFMRELMFRYPISKNKMIFVLSEIDYYSNTLKYEQTIQSLRIMGVLIALDRFGEYHSSLLYFREIEVDMVRFDARYTKNLSSLRYREVVNGLDVMVKTLNSKSWMKMIEDEALCRLSDEIGINFKEGKYLDNLKELE